MAACTVGDVGALAHGDVDAVEHPPAPSAADAVGDVPRRQRGAGEPVGVAEARRAR